MAEIVDIMDTQQDVSMEENINIRVARMLLEIRKNLPDWNLTAPATVQDYRADVERLYSQAGDARIRTPGKHDDLYIPVVFAPLAIEIEKAGIEVCDIICMGKKQPDKFKIIIFCRDHTAFARILNNTLEVNEVVEKYVSDPGSWGFEIKMMPDGDVYSMIIVPGRSLDFVYERFANYNAQH